MERSHFNQNNSLTESFYFCFLSLRMAQILESTVKCSTTKNSSHFDYEFDFKLLVLMTPITIRFFMLLVYHLKPFIDLRSLTKRAQIDDFSFSTHNKEKFNHRHENMLPQVFYWVKFNLKLKIKRVNHTVYILC